MSPAPRQPRRPFNVPLWFALATTLVCAGWYALHRKGSLEIPGLEAWEHSALDARFRIRGVRAPADDRIVIVALDDRARLEQPELWQTRRGFARLLERVAAAQPRIVGIDAFFSSPEVNLSPRAVRAVERALAALALEPHTTVSAEVQQALELVFRETQGDAMLAEAMQRAERLILATLFFLDGPPAERGAPEPSALAKARFDEFVFLAKDSSGPPQAHSASLPLTPIAQAVVALGHVNVHRDSDGAVRTLPLAIERAGRFYQSLSLRIASAERQASVTYVQGEEHITLGDTKIPVDSRSMARIAYLGPNQTFAHVSAADVFAATEPLPALRDKIVLVGYTDTARDKLPTPFDQQLDGVELHATVVHNLLHDELLRRASPMQSIAVMLAIGFVLSLMQLRSLRSRRSWTASLVALGGAIVYVVVAQLLFSHYGFVLDVVAPVLAIVGITLAAMTASLATEGREKARLRAAFSQYVHESLVDRILADPDKVRLGGERRSLTVLFSDIRGFSKFSETLEPEVLSDFLNEYLTPMTDLVLQEDGMLDKYVGDAVMAVYGAPLPLEDHPLRACRTALAMLDALKPLNDGWRRRGLPEISIGIGINTGIMSVGNMGSAARFDYTVMGDAVNLAARLESLTKTYQVGILVGEETRRAAEHEMVFREIDSVRVVGRAAAARVYELCGTRSRSPVSPEQAELFAEALQAYRAREWDRAEALRAQFAAIFPDDRPCQVLAERIESLRRNPPGDDWDGVHEQRNK